MLADDLSRLGARTTPYHLAIDFPLPSGRRCDACCHVYRLPLPRKALIRLNEDTKIVSPELLFIELAAAKGLDEIDLLLTGYELCGTYVLDPDDDSWSGLISEGVQLTTCKKISRMIEMCAGRKGVARARKAIELVNDGSNSPMETVLAMLLSLPRVKGGFGLYPIEMNRKVSTLTGDRWVDILFAGRKVGLEYKGREAHSIEKTGRDDRRQNKLVGSGIAILNVWYEDLADPVLFDQLVHDIHDALGVRLRIRDKGFAQRQEDLRLRLMPSMRRFGSVILGAHE